VRSWPTFTTRGGLERPRQGESLRAPRVSTDSNFSGVLIEDTVTVADSILIFMRGGEGTSTCTQLNPAGRFAAALPIPVPGRRGARRGLRYVEPRPAPRFSRHRLEAHMILSRWHRLPALGVGFTRAGLRRRGGGGRYGALHAGRGDAAREDDRRSRHVVLQQSAPHGLERQRATPAAARFRAWPSTGPSRPATAPFPRPKAPRARAVCNHHG